jgi:phosphomannomutase
MELSADIEKRIQEWLSGPYDEKTKAEIRALREKDPASLADAFYTELSFGTAGLRGLMGIGTTRMNQYTVQMATQGLANYLGPNKKVLIGYDSRHHSRSFAEYTARVLAANGIQALLLKELRPTPFVSFGCRYLKCDAAVMITASHNPAQYNGYKVYWSDGAQVVAPHDIGIMKEVHRVTIEQVKTAALDDPRIKIIDASLDTAYLDAIDSLKHFPEEMQKEGKTLKIAYTSLHGTGITLVPKALKRWGFPTIHYVEKQITIDGDFPTVKVPNPEYAETLSLGIDTLMQTKSDVLLATDPDADRMGVVVLHRGKPQILNGNEVASICTYFLCETLQAQNKVPERAAFVTTIVSTDLIKAIADSFKIACFEVLTGFKYIGEKIHLWESTPNGYHFIFGAEESYGYLLGTVARDKDAVLASCLLSEIALMNKQKGRTLVDLLDEIYQKYGVYQERQFALNFPAGKAGGDQIQGIMQRLRKQLPSTFCNREIILLEDYATGTRHFMKSGKKEALILPRSDVLLFRLSDTSKVIIRPSGTEPKIKIYAGVSEKNFSSIDHGIALCNQRLDELIETVKNELK